MIPVSVFLSTLMSHVLALVLMIAASAVWINQISLFLILLPIYFVVVGLLAVGLGWIVASLHVFLRDTAQVVSVLLIFWFWLTPIFITEKQFPPWAHFLLVANPLYYVVGAYRTILLGSGVPNLEDLAIATVYSAAVFIAGGLFFRHMKRGFADVL
jgi:ABC-type polysaccharide/polyol phosphate export permease